MAESASSQPDIRGFAVGHSIPLGLVAYGVPTFLLGWVLAGRTATPALQVAALMPLVLIVGGVLQFIAGLWAYRTGHALAATFFCIFGGVAGTIALFEVGAGSVVRTSLQLGLLSEFTGSLAVITACFTFVALFIAVAGLPSRMARVAVGELLSKSGVGITSLALAVSLFFITWSLFAGGNQLLTAISGWASVVSGGLALLSAAAATLGTGLMPQLARGPLGGLLPMTRSGSQRPSAV